MTNMAGSSSSSSGSSGHMNQQHSDQHTMHRQQDTARWRQLNGIASKQPEAHRCQRQRSCDPATAATAGLQPPPPTLLPGPLRCSPAPQPLPPAPLWAAAWLCSAPAAPAGSRPGQPGPCQSCWPQAPSVQEPQLPPPAAALQRPLLLRQLGKRQARLPRGGAAQCPAPLVWQTLAHPGLLPHPASAAPSGLCSRACQEGSTKPHCPVARCRPRARGRRGGQPHPLLPPPQLLLLVSGRAARPAASPPGGAGPQTKSWGCSRALLLSWLGPL